MEKIRIGVVILLAILLLLSLFSCHRRIPWDYRESSFRAEIRWQSSAGTILTGELTGGRDEFSLCFRSPPEMEGIVLTYSDGETTLTLDGMVAEGLEVGDWLSVRELIFPIGEMKAVALSEWKGERLLYAEVKEERSEGERIYEMYLDEKTGIPREIRWGDRSVEIVFFEKMA